MSADRFRRLPAFRFHAKFASLELSMLVTELKGGGVALPIGPSIEFIMKKHSPRDPCSTRNGRPVRDEEF